MLPDTRYSLIARLSRREQADSWCEFLESNQMAIIRYCRSRGLQDADSRAIFASAICVLFVLGGLGGWALWRVAEHLPNPNQSYFVVDDPESTKGSELSPELSAWVERLVQVENHNAMAFRVGNELLKLPSSDSLAVATAAWPRIQEPTVKTGISTTADVEDIPCEDIRIGGDSNKRYFLIGDSKGACPDEGFKLAIIMPGGDGGEDFNPFVRRIHKYALGGDWIVAEPVAVYWSKAQEIVWPTKKDAVADSQFSTEEFVGMVIDDVKTRAKINSKNIVTLTWSSSGPAGYAIALQPETPVTGSYIAMSVFRPEWYPTIASAKHRRFLIDHSPQDRVCPYSMSIYAEKKLLEAGAEFKRIEYEGGHGLHGDVYSRITEGMEWLTRKR